MLRSMPGLDVCLFAFAGLNSVWAQAPAATPSPAFAVASVKQGLQQSGGSRLPYSGFLGTGGNPIKIAGNRITLAGTLNVLIMAAYNVKDYQVTGGPPWTDSDVFTIVAKTEGEDTPKLEDVRTMLQALLADRFQLQLHRDKKELSVYNLVVAKKSPKLKPSAPGEKFGQTFDPATPGTLRSSFTKITMTDFAHLVSVYADRPVVDKTGLEGEYDYSIEWSTDSGDVKRAIMAAVQEQLGLKYEAAKEPVDALVIDHVDKLSPD
jgi:uncharacterized protein (TIGR03435 family)